jgi:nitrite reductase/ring-hydroxylating ferredoxin subunit/Fe-S cluster biogenesis protein NfuA
MTVHAQQPPRDETDADDLLGEVDRLESLIAGWDGSQRSLAFAYRRAIEAVQKAALRKLIAAVKAEPGGLDALRAATADPLLYTVLRHHGLVRPSIQERVEAALASVRPILAAHGGNVEFVAFVPPDRVEVRFLGNCDHCPSSTLTFIAGVRRAIEDHCPEITDIRQVKGMGTVRHAVDFVSPFASGGWRFALPFESIPEGGIKALLLDGEPLLFSRAGGKVVCFRDACAHLGLLLSDGQVSEGKVTCRHHGFTYDLATGECLTVPEVQLSPMDVRLAGDHVEIRREA